MTSTLTFPDLPADHPLNTGKGIISLHSTEVLTKPHMFIDLPYQHDKHDRCGRTCRNCTSSFCEAKWKVGCYTHDEKPAHGYNFSKTYHVIRHTQKNQQLAL